MGALACDSVVMASYEMPDVASSFLSRLCSNLLLASIFRFALLWWVAMTDVVLNFIFAAVDVFSRSSWQSTRLWRKHGRWKSSRAFPVCWLLLSSMSLAPSQVHAFTCSGLHGLHSVHPCPPMSYQGYMTFPNGLWSNLPKPSFSIDSDEHASHASVQDPQAKEDMLEEIGRAHV